MENDLHRDIRDHIEMETRDNIERGMSPGEARSAAQRKLGNTLRIMEDTRAVWRWMWADRLLQDVRHGLRGLRRNPVFAAVVILTLALGIGMNTAVFSVIDAVLIKPLPYPHPERLVWLSNHIPAFKADIVHAADYLDWRAQSQSFDKMFDYGYRDSSQSTVAEVSSDFWPVSGVRPLHGRLFVKGDDNVVVLAYPLFKRRFGADSSIVGKTIVLEGESVTVVGVLPEGFRFVLPTMERPDVIPKEVDAYVPSNIPPETQRGHILVYVAARLKPGVPLAQARSELETIQARIARQNPGIDYSSMTLKVAPLRDQLVGNARPALLILFGAAACVLLIACANVAGLLLARAAARRREVAIRAAVGAGQFRMITQFLTEAMVLAIAGGAAGLLLARGAIAMLLRLAPRAVPRLEGTAIDERVLVFTLLLTLGSALLFGLGPALSLARANLQHELKEGRKIPSGGLRRLRPRSLLVAAEIAIALVLTVGAGLMLKSLWRMSARPPGFDPEKILAMKVSLTGPAYRAKPQQIAYFEELVDRLGHAPGAVAAGTVFSPVRGVIQFEGPPGRPRDGLPKGTFYSTSPGYFRAMGIRLLAGRWMSVTEPSRVVLVNESFQRQLFGGANPLGKHVQMPDLKQPPPQAEIVGVVSDVKYSKLDVEPGPEVYFPFRQSFFTARSDVVVLTSGDPLAFAPTARQLISGIDPSQPVLDMQTLETALADSIAPRRFNLLLLGTFAATALLLALIGIYGAMSYAVTQRTHEIGVRMALGADRGDVMRMVVRQGMVVALTGIVAGTAAALGLTRLLATLLYDVKPDDPTTLAAVGLCVLATSLLASWLPAFKAARVDPLAALRCE